MDLNEKQILLAETMQLGMSMTQAAKHVGIGMTTAKRWVKLPEFIQYAEQLSEEARAQYRVSRDDVIAGFKRAIDDAILVSDPGNQINGWREIGRMLGYYAPEEKKLVLTADQTATRKMLEQKTDEELLQMATNATLIEGEWEEVEDEDA